jgi:hypothetical protein
LVSCIVAVAIASSAPQKHICRLVTNPQTGNPLDPKSLRKTSSPGGDPVAA